MARIRTYDLDTELSANDYLLGNDGDNGSVITKRFSLDDLKEFFGQGIDLTQVVPKRFIPTLNQAGDNVERSTIQLIHTGATNIVLATDSGLGGQVANYAIDQNGVSSLVFEDFDAPYYLPDFVGATVTYTTTLGTATHTAEILSYDGFMEQTGTGVVLDTFTISAGPTEANNVMRSITISSGTSISTSVIGNLVTDSLTTDAATINGDLEMNGNILLDDIVDQIVFNTDTTEVSIGPDATGAGIDGPGEIDINTTTNVNNTELNLVNSTLEFSNTNNPGEGIIIDSSGITQFDEDGNELPPIQAVEANPTQGTERGVLTDLRVGNERWHLPLAQSTIASVLPGLLEGLSPTSNEPDDEWFADVVSVTQEITSVPITYTLIGTDEFQILNNDILYFGATLATNLGFVAGGTIGALEFTFDRVVPGSGGTVSPFRFTFPVQTYNLLDGSTTGPSEDAAIIIDLGVDLGGGNNVDNTTGTFINADGTETTTNITLGSIEPVTDITGDFIFEDSSVQSTTDNIIVVFDNGTVPTAYFSDGGTIEINLVRGEVSSVTDDGTNITDFTFTYDMTQLVDGTQAGDRFLADPVTGELPQGVQVSRTFIGGTGDFWYGTDFGTFSSYDADISYTFPPGHAVHPNVTVTAIPSQVISLGVTSHTYDIASTDSYTVLGADNSTASDITITGEDLDDIITSVFGNLPTANALFFHIAPSALPAAATTDPDNPAIVQGNVYEVVNYLNGVLSFSRLTSGSIIISASEVRFTNIPDTQPGQSTLLFADSNTGAVSRTTLERIAGSQAVLNYQSLDSTVDNGSVTSIQFNSGPECHNVETGGGAIIVDVTGRFNVANAGADVLPTSPLALKSLLAWNSYILGNNPFGSTDEADRTLQLPPSATLEAGDTIKLFNLSNIDAMGDTIASDPWVVVANGNDRILKLPIGETVILDHTETTSFVWSGNATTGWVIE